MVPDRVDPVMVTATVKTARKRFPAWLFFSLVTIVFWGVWGALTKVISADIDAYMNQVLFAIGVLPVMAIVLLFGRLSGGVSRKRGARSTVLSGKPTVRFPKWRRVTATGSIR